MGNFVISSTAAKRGGGGGHLAGTLRCIVCNCRTLPEGLECTAATIKSLRHAPSAAPCSMVASKRVYCKRLTLLSGSYRSQEYWVGCSRFFEHTRPLVAESQEQAKTTSSPPTAEICFAFSWCQIRRRQRKAFLTANAERGLYFTPQLYDGFMSLLQQAKAAALAAQAGAYDETTKCNAVDSDGCAYATLAGERRQQPPLDADDGTGNETTHLNNKESGSANEKESGSRDDDERLSYSTRPPSDVSSGGDDGDDDRQEHKSDPGDAKQSPYGNDGAPGRLEQRTKNVEDDVQNVGGRYLSGVAAPRKLTVEEEAAEGVSEVPAIGVAEDGNGSTATSHQDSSGNNREEAEAVAGKGVSMEALKNMLQMLDCGEWDGAVSTVLDAIESLSKWIPPPTADGESPLDQNKNFTQSGHVDKSKAVFNLGAAVLQGSDNGRGDGGTSSGSQAEADGTEGESDNDGEEEEQEEAEEEATDTDAEDKKEEEEEEEEEADEGGHPIFCKQKALRAQWRRLVLDAQLEPATDCGTIMRDEVGTMLNDIAGAMEEVRRDVGNVTGGAETPRGTVLRYDEVRCSMGGLLSAKRYRLAAHGSWKACWVC